MATKEQVQTVGRRKLATARIVMEPGSGAMEINGRPLMEYFPLLRHQSAVEEPLKVTEAADMYDVSVRVRGGGITGQAEAIQMGLARALLEFDEERRNVLRNYGLLTRDARMVERKKPGRPKARKRFQFSKR